MAELNVQSAGLDGVNLTYSAADGAGDHFTNNGNSLLYVKNDDTSSKTVTVDSVAPCNFGFNHDVEVTVSAGETEVIGTFPMKRFNDEDQSVNVSYDDVTSVSVAVLEVK